MFFTDLPMCGLVTVINGTPWSPSTYLKLKITFVTKTLKKTILCTKRFGQVLSHL